MAARTLLEQLDVPFLGHVPLDPAVVLGGDEGLPVVKRDPESAAAKALVAVAHKAREQAAGHESTQDPRDDVLMDPLKPLKLEKWETQGIKIHWNDGHISQYRSGWLRARCPCASCQEEANKPVAQPTGLNLLPVVDPSSEQLASLKPTGHYAYNIAFKDGHATGIFAFEYLRSICECDECRREGYKRASRSALAASDSGRILMAT